MSPGVAHKYLSELVKDFDAYAKKHYLGALQSPRPAPSNTLAALRYIATRKLPDYEPRLREIFTTRFAGTLGREIDAACLDALLETTDDPVQIARFFADVACRKKPLPTSRLAVTGLERLGSHGCQALLDELSAPQPRHRWKKAAQLLEQISGVPSGRRASFWTSELGPERIDELHQWRDLLVAAEKLPPPEEMSSEQHPAEEDYWKTIFDQVDSKEPAPPQ